jgi:hypothetical protein
MTTPGNSINESTTGMIGFTGSAFTATPVTAHDVLIGGSTSSTISQAAPSATSGVPLISQGASSDPAFGTAVVAGGGTGTTSFTAYAVICSGTTSTGVLQNVSGVGTAAQVLTSNGAGNLPTWQASGSGNLVLIQSQSPSGSSGITFTTGISATYNNYLLVFSNVTLSGSIQLLVQLSTNAGVSYISTGYATGQNVVPYNSTSLTNTNFTSGLLLVDRNSTSTINGYCYLQNMTSGSNYVTSVGNLSLYDTGSSASSQAFTVGSYDTASTIVDAIQVVPSSGTFSGTFTLFGYLE